MRGDEQMNIELDKGRHAAILGIGTAIPRHQIVQAEVSLRLAEALRDYPDSVRWARRIFKQCGVETRYTCEPSLVGSTEECRYLPSSPLEEVPSTKERMEVYKRESLPLGLEAARKALIDSGTEPAAITHIITVSCTGQYLPGLDALLVRALELPSSVNRIPLQFLGCAAGLKAICLASQLVQGTPHAKVLIVCVELCTLHIQPSAKKESLFGASFFGDGASACVVGFAQPNHQGYFQLGEDCSVLLPDSSEEMVWEVGNRGFDLYLSPNIPRILGRYLPAELERFLGGQDKPELWAIHPRRARDCRYTAAVVLTYGRADQQQPQHIARLRQFIFCDDSVRAGEDEGRAELPRGCPRQWGRFSIWAGSDGRNHKDNLCLKV